MKKSFSCFVIALAISPSLFAGKMETKTEASSKKVVLPAETEFFRAHEWQADIAVVGAAGTFRGKPSESIGGNCGVNYFVTKYLGVGIDNSVSGYGTPSSIKASERLQADLLLRYPIENWHLAPYIMVGGGATWDTSSQGNGNVGGGFDYRLTHHIALFGDVRWLYGNSTQGIVSTAMPRAGVRFVF